MAYTKEFIEKVKQVYPSSKKMIELAESGSSLLGRYLDDSRSAGVSAEFILTHSYDEIVAAAKEVEAKNGLYRAWLDGSGFIGGADRKYYCPANHMLNSSDPDREALSQEICRGVGYVGFFPACVRYMSKDLCWKKYDELKKKKRESGAA